MIIYHNNEIATTKMINQDEHGVGIKNIIRIVEKYNGEYVIQNDEDQFYFSIIIPYEEKILGNQRDIIESY